MAPQDDTPARRLAVLNGHMRKPHGVSQVDAVEASVCHAAGAGGKSPDDVVIVSALRTPICKAKRGGLAKAPADDLLSAVLEGTRHATGVEPTAVGDIVVGSVLGDGSQRAIVCRMGALLSGYPDVVPVRTVNRQCSSGLQAIADVAASIKAGYYDIGIGAGVESMTNNPMKWDGGINPKIETNASAASCILPMGITSENVAEAYGISRDQQDKMAAESHRRAAVARSTGRFRDEIVPVKAMVADKTGEEKEVLVANDDGIREGVTAAQLSQLKPAFKKGGTTTAGNASQVSDGAAAAMLMKRSEAAKRGLKVLGTFKSFAAVGCDPAVMGIGPAVAIPEALKKAGLSTGDIDLFELNEAFASQATYCAQKLGLDPAKVNVNGGAIALGHPLGATGARCTATLLHEMQKRGPSCKYGIVSMCIGSGMGAAAVFERGD